MDALWVNLECNFDTFTVTVTLAAYPERMGTTPKKDGGRIKCVRMPKKLQRININFLTIINENEVEILPCYFFMHYTF